MQTTWNKEEIELLISNKDLRLHKLKKLLPNKTPSSIQHKRHRLKLTTNHKWTNEDVNKLKEHYPISTKEQLIEMFNLSWQKIKIKANKHKIHQNIIKNHKIEKLLSESNESFYWIGFLLADGCFYGHKKEQKTNYGLSLEISTKDKNHLYNFAKYIDYKNKTRKRKRIGLGKIRNRIIQSSKFGTVAISLNDNIVIKQIMEKFDIHFKKTHFPPDKMKYQKFSDEQIISLICGFIDGDGCVTLAKKKTPRIFIENYKTWFNFHVFIEDFLYKYFNLTKIRNHTILRKATNYQSSVLSITNTKMVNNLFDTIRKLNLPYLERKWDKLIGLPTTRNCAGH